MPRKTVISDSYVFDALVLDKYRVNGTNSSERRQMLKLVYNAMRKELTDYQFYCLKEYYIKGRKMKDLALEKGVNPSTVTRTIRRAKQKISKITDYYFNE
mgnify:CR=1 FL=1